MITFLGPFGELRFQSKLPLSNLDGQVNRSSRPRSAHLEYKLLEPQAIGTRNSNFYELLRAELDEHEGKSLWEAAVVGGPYTSLVLPTGTLPVSPG